MHVTSRIMRVAGGQTAEATSMVRYLIGLLNENLGANFRASVMIGGDPNVINATGMWDSMEQYESFRAAVGADEEISMALRIGAAFFSDDLEDTLWKVESAPGDGDRYATITTARVDLGQVQEAMTFAAEAAATVGEITGNAVGLASAVTGDVSRILWVGYASTLSELEANREAMNASSDYAEVLGKAGGVLVPGSIESNIWQNI